MSGGKCIKNLTVFSVPYVTLAFKTVNILIMYYASAEYRASGIVCFYTTVVKMNPGDPIHISFFSILATFEQMNQNVVICLYLSRSLLHVRPVLCFATCLCAAM